MNLVNFCLIVYKKSNYSIHLFISNFIEGINMDNEKSLVQKQNSELESYAKFVKLESK